MSVLPTVLAWVHDPEVWEWIRTALAALAGAAVGGGFTVAAQKRAASAQEQRDNTAHTRSIAGERRSRAEADVRKLHSLVSALTLGIDSQAKSLLQVIGQAPWSHEWNTIWTRTTRSEIRVLIDMIPTLDTRERMLQLYRFLDNAQEHSWEAFWPDAPERKLHVLVGQLAAEATETLATYLRGDELSSRRGELLANLEREAAEYARWEQHEVEVSEQNAARSYEQAPAEERAKMDESVDRFFGRPRRQPPVEPYIAP